MQRFLSCAVMGLTAVTASAGDYDYELTFSLGGSDTSTASDVNDSRFSSDTDAYSLTGRWFYDGLSDTNGPRSRAPFLDRTSSLALSFERTERGNSQFLPAPVFGPVNQTTTNDSDSDTLELALRHVWDESGWYALASYARVERDLSSRVLIDGQPPTFVFDGSSDATTYSLGVGKYVLPNTALQFEVADLEAGSNARLLFGEGRTYDLSLTHIGKVTDVWSFAIDAAVSRSDADSGGEADGYALSTALLPGNDLEFGVGFSRFDADGFAEREELDVFTSWFVRENIELRARYRDIRSNFEFDSDRFDVGVNVRF